MSNFFAKHLLIRCVQPVVSTSTTTGKMVGLFAGIQPTIFLPVSKWVDLYDIYPRGYKRLFPTHFLDLTSVKILLSTFSTSPIISNIKVNELKKEGFWL